MRWRRPKAVPPAHPPPTLEPTLHDMADIVLHRTHQLGLTRAREIAWQWAEEAEAQFGMECTVDEGDHEDSVYFTRSGVKGTLRVTGESFDLEARLGILLGAFRGTIEAEIEKNLDALLAREGQPTGGAEAKATKAAKTKAPAAKKQASRK